MASVTENKDGSNADRGGKKLPFKARNPEETKEGLLLAAIDEFAEFGYLGARVERIVKRCGVTLRMLYHYFKNKDFLYVAVLQHVFTEIEALEQAFELRSREPEEQLHEIIDFTFDHYRSQTQFVQLVLGESLLEAKHLRKFKSATALGENLKSRMQRVLKEGQDSGIFEPDIDDIQLWGTIFTLCWPHSSGGGMLFGEVMDASNTDAVEARRKHVHQVVSIYLKPQR
jgi:TetR/AcrR family transcriptional regulator